jgi:hypothetical protein
VERAQGPKVEIILVKYNQPAMEADTIRHVLRTAGYENYSLRAHQARKGEALSKTWNRLIDQSDAQLICLLNTDTIPTEGWLKRMVRLWESSPASVVVPSSNRVHMSQVEVPFEDWETDVDRIQEFADELEDEVGDHANSLPTCSAMCVLFSKVVWEMLGGFDEEFEFYGEDTHFFYRVTAELNRQILWARGIYVHHLGSQSFIKAANDGELDYYGLRKKAGALWMRKKAEVDDRVSRRKHS